MTSPRDARQGPRQIARRIGSASARGFSILREMVVDFVDGEERVKLPRLQLPMGIGRRRNAPAPAVEPTSFPEGGIHAEQGPQA